MREHMTQNAENNELNKQLQALGGAHDSEGLLKLLDELGPNVPEVVAAAELHLGLEDAFKKAQTDLGSVKDAKPWIPDTDHTLSDEEKEHIRKQGEGFENATKHFLDGFTVSLDSLTNPAGADEEAHEEKLPCLKRALDDQAEQHDVLDMFTRIDELDIAELLEAARMVRGDVAEELWQAVMAGRDVASFLHTDDERLGPALEAWKQEVQEGIGVAEDRLQGVIHWLETNK